MPRKKKCGSNFWKGGRTVLFQQAVNVTYTVPTNKIPFLDWTTIRAAYASTYQWTTASLLAINLGNSIQNTQQIEVIGDFNFRRLYAKWGLLRTLDQSDNPSRPPGPPPKGTDTAKNKKPPGEDLNNGNQLHGVTKALAKIVTMVKDVTVNYSQNSMSSIYGYTDSTSFLGMDLKSGQPGLGYVFGLQPDTNFVNRLGKKGYLTHDTTFNFQNQASYTQLMNITAQVQPVRDLNITVSWNKSFGKNYTELYKDTIGGSDFVRLNPYTAGSFSVSYIL